MRLIYVSQGNIPSKWAHTFQAMKMAEAMGRLVPDFRLLTQVHWRHWLRGRFDYESWYGIRHPFRIVRMVRRSHLPPSPVFDFVSHEQFDRAAARYAARHRPCLVYTRSPHAGALCVDAGVDTIVEAHVHTDEVKFEHIRRVAQRPELKGLVTISEPLRDLYVSAGVDAGKVMVWPDAVDPEIFAQEPDRGSLRRELSLPADVVIAVYCGHLYEHRGVEEILAVAKEVPDVLFLLVGGREQDVLSRRREAEGLRNVRFEGFVPNARVPAYLQAGDMLLMPYSDRCHTAVWMSPLKMFEYMAARRPIIATDLPAIREYLVHEKSALLVRPGCSGELAGSVRRLRDSPRLGEALAGAAHEKVQPYTWMNRARDVLERFAEG